MIGSSSPLAERPGWHPVHRANALLRAALLSSTHPSEPFEGSQNIQSLSHAIASVMAGPLRLSHPRSLAERLDDLAAEEEDAFPAFEALMGVPPRHARIEAAGRLGPSEAPYFEADGPLGDVAEPAWDEADDGFGLDEAESFADDDALDPNPYLLPPQLHVQTLLREFHRRQRRVSLLVAGSIATAALLTVGGLLLVASLSAPHAGDDDNRPSPRSTSIAWQKPVQSAAVAGPEFATVSANRAVKGERLLVPTIAGAVPVSLGEVSSAPQTILAASGRRIAFAPLLPPSHAGYLLIRGLPAEAELSAGRRSESGTWLVKGDLVHDLTLSIGQAAEGDYPIEIYVLQSGAGPQARRSLVLRVEAPVPTFAVVGPDMGWASAIFDVVPSAHAAEAPAPPAEAAVLRDRAKRLLDEGDIAAARLLLLHLAERGEGEAAYDLARTFDGEMLAELGARGMNGDPARAQRWYERASQVGNAKATERLKILASLSGSGPSD